MSESIGVLHVDDEPDVAEVTADFLEREDDRIEVVTETRVSDGLDRLATEEFDCIISDYDMPEMDGLAFLEQVRDDYDDLPFILFTGKGSEEVASEALSAGATDYLQKEVGTDQYTILANRVVNSVETARAKSQRQRQLDAIETAQDGISLLDEDGQFIYVNEAYADLYGYDPEDMVGEHWALLYPDDDVEFVHKEILPTVTEDGDWRGETTGLRADGSTFVEDHTLSTTDTGELICTVRDVTDQQEREQELEARSAAMETASDGIALLDACGEYTYVNQAHAEIYGYDDPEAFIGESWRMCYTDDKVAEFEDQVLPVLETDGQWRGEATGKRRDGSSFPQEVTLTALEEGGFVCIVRDISDRRERERELERKTALLEKTQQMATVGGWELDLHDDELRWTGEIHRIHELPLDYEPELESALEFFHPEDTHCIEDAVERAIEDGESFDIELRLITANDNLRWVRALGEPRQEDGETTVLRGAFQDITERTEHEDRIGSLHEGNRQLMNANTPEEVASVTVEIANQILDKPLSAMWFYDEAANRLEPATATDSTREFLDTLDVTELPPIREGKFGMDVFRDGELTVIEDTETITNPTFPNLPLETVIVAPLGNHGILAMTADSIDEITERDRHQINILTLNAQTALDRAQREQALTRRQEMIESLHTATRDMVEMEDAEQVCKTAVNAADQLLNLPITAIWLSDDTGRRLDPVAQSEEGDRVIDELPVYTAAEESLSWQAFESGETQVYDNLQTEASLANTETPIQSEIIVPLGEYGVMNFGSQTSHTFDETDVRAAELLGANTATALERVEREQKLETQLDRMEFFNSILRHDVLNGMTVIRGRAELLTDELDGDQLRDAETILDWCDDIIDIVQRVRTTLDTLTDDGSIQIKPVELSETLQEELGRIQETYPEVTFETAIPDSVRVQGNELLSDVFGNIITNAMDHNDTEGLYVSITATEWEEDDTVIVRIADNGKGVPDEAKETIFHRDATGHAKSYGSGFGLFFVDAMVEKYGGDVRVEENDTGGATFVLKLPLAEANTPA